MELIDLLERGWHQAEPVIAELDPDAVRRPSACAGWTVKETLNHTLNVCRMMNGVNRGDPAKLGELDLVGDGSGLLELWREEGRANVASWRAAGLAGERAYQWATFPAPAAAAINISEILLHCWDLAPAAGVAYALDSEVAQPAWDVYSAAPLDGMREMGELGPAVAVPEDAPVGERLLGLTGRRP